MPLRRWACWGVVVTVLAAGTGCASLLQGPAPEERVAERALERRQALIQGDFEKAYDYLSPGYRANTSLRQYQGQFGGAVAWTDAEVREVRCEREDVCTATVLLSYKVSVPGFRDREGRRPLREQWIRSQRAWWYLPEP